MAGSDNAQRGDVTVADLILACLRGIHAPNGAPQHLLLYTVRQSDAAWRRLTHIMDGARVGAANASRVRLPATLGELSAGIRGGISAFTVTRVTPRRHLRRGGGASRRLVERVGGRRM